VENKQEQKRRSKWGMYAKQEKVKMKTRLQTEQEERK
jgi:hypothetical protein